MCSMPFYLRAYTHTNIHIYTHTHAPTSARTVQPSVGGRLNLSHKCTHTHTCAQDGENNTAKRGRPPKSEPSDNSSARPKKKQKKTMQTDEDNMHKEKGEIDADIHKFVSQVIATEEMHDSHGGDAC